MPKSLARTAALLATLAPCAADAAELTDVSDAFDDEAGNPFDLRLEPTISKFVESGVIAREAGCDASADGARCDIDSTVFNRELEFERIRTSLDLTLKLGLAPNLEFHATLPFVFHDRTRLKLASDVTASTSMVDPSDARIQADLSGGASDNYEGFFGTYRYFDIATEGDGERRHGLGDISIGFAWSPLESTAESPTGTLLLGVDYTMPSANPAERTNSDVGKGLHTLLFTLAASRPIAATEPYFKFALSVPIPGSQSLFQEESADQRLVGPGIRFDTTLGSELTIYDDPQVGQRYTFGADMTYGYQVEGRDYTPLSEAISRSACNGLTPAEAGYRASNYGTGVATDGVPDGNKYQPAAGTTISQASCAWIVQAPANQGGTAGTKLSERPYIHDGISDIEGYGIIGGHVAFNLQFRKWIEFRVFSNLEWQSPHFLTNADAGTDTDGDGSVNLDPDGGERNPYFNLALDAHGRRFRTDGALRVGWGITAAWML